jgi:riboflavin transporter FmnP
VFALIGLALSFVEIPGLLDINILKYDASSVAALMLGLIFGPAIGCLVGAGITIVHGLFVGNLFGVIINLCLVVVFVTPPALAFRYKGTFLSIVIGLLIGAVLAVGVNTLLNIIILPYYMGLPMDAILAMVPTDILPFSLVKVGLNTLFSFIFVFIFWAVLRLWQRKSAKS